MNGRPLVEKKTERESTTLRLARDHETARECRLADGWLPWLFLTV